MRETLISCENEHQLLLYFMNTLPIIYQINLLRNYLGLSYRSADGTNAFITIKDGFLNKIIHEVSLVRKDILHLDYKTGN